MDILLGANPTHTHKKDCPKLRGGKCNCDPEPIKREKPETLNQQIDKLAKWILENMTEEQIKQKTSGKIQSINILYKQLQIEVLAKQVVTQNGIIENVVFYNDMEKYDINKEEPKK
jgi:uncharacterized protein (DUF2344 family)